MEQLNFSFFKELSPPVLDEIGPSATALSKLVFKETQSCKQHCQHQKPLAKIKTDDVLLVAMKCSCGSSWCRTCSKRRWAPDVAEKLMKFDWQATRQIVLTVDRNKFETGQAAYEYVKQKKMLPQLIHNLKRTTGIVIDNWLWVLEWHKDGHRVMGSNLYS